jgi:hypothetical protein
METEAAMQTVDTFVHGTFNSTSLFKLVTCFAGEVDMVADMADGALDQYVQATQSVPAQAFSIAGFIAAMLLLFLGIYLVRAVNFICGFYVGSSLAMFLLDLFAMGTPLMDECAVLLAIVSGSALLVGIICLMKRRSMYALIGLVAGEIVGKFVYHLVLENSGYGTNTLYVSIGFFAVVGAYAAKEVGDLAWMICTALMGAYFATTAFVELVIIPYVPDGANYAAFLAYRPAPSVTSIDTQVKDVSTSKYLWAPLGGFLVLAFIGLLTQLACYNKMMRSRSKLVPLV